MAITINHQTNDISATSGTITIDGAGIGATGGGNDAIFFENGQSVTANYTIGSSTNAVSAGPITIDDGIVVTITSGSRWVVV